MECEIEKLDETVVCHMRIIVMLCLKINISSTWRQHRLREPYWMYPLFTMYYMFHLVKNYIIIAQLYYV